MTSKKPIDQTFPKQTGIGVALPANRWGGARGVGFLRPRGSPKRGCDGQAEAFRRGDIWNSPIGSAGTDIRSHRALAYAVHGSVVARAFVMGPPEGGVITMGGFDTADEAKLVAERFEVPLNKGADPL